MPDQINIIAIEGRTEVSNGVSRPFRCLGENDAEYFVKLKNVGWNQLVKEWIAGRLAQEMGLPCAEIAQVIIPQELVKGNQAYETELGHGVAFGSLRVVPSERLSLSLLPERPDAELSRILLFDWWVRNSDRALSETGGNPNLLWQLDQPRVVMIDHDNAFDEQFDPKAFWGFHALRAHASNWEIGCRKEMDLWLTAGLSCFERIWDELPEQWLFDSYGDPQCTLDKEDLKGVLSCFTTNPDFWLPPVMS